MDLFYRFLHRNFKRYLMQFFIKLDVFILMNKYKLLCNFKTHTNEDKPVHYSFQISQDADLFNIDTTD